MTRVKNSSENQLVEVEIFWNPKVGALQRILALGKIIVENTQAISCIISNLIKCLSEDQRQSATNALICL